MPLPKPSVPSPPHRTSEDGRQFADNEIGVRARSIARLVEVALEMGKLEGLREALEIANRQPIYFESAIEARITELEGK